LELDKMQRGRVFQELPSQRELAPEVLVNFDSRGRISLGTMAYKHADYFFAMVRKISEKWHMYFPVMPHYYGLMRDGEVLVVFELDLDGRVVRANVEKSYGQPTLDRACLQAITEAADFGPIPGEFRERGKLTVPFLFVYHRPDQPLKMFH
jgi:TonB family protein